MATQKVFSPSDGSLVAERITVSPAELEQAVQRAHAAQHEWRQTPLAERRQRIEAAVQFMLAHADEIGEELTRQMGRPIRYTPFDSPWS